MNDDHGKSNAKATYENIAEMVAALNCDYDRLEELREFQKDEGLLMSTDEREELRALTAAATLDGTLCENAEAARERISEDPLSVEVRSGWYSPGAAPDAPEEFCILLSTGGPAARIRGELGVWAQPTRAWLEYQDWGTPWMQYFNAKQDTLLAYCGQFCFGE